MAAKCMERIRASRESVQARNRNLMSSGSVTSGGGGMLLDEDDDDDDIDGDDDAALSPAGLRLRQPSARTPSRRGRRRVQEQFPRPPPPYSVSSVASASGGMRENGIQAILREEWAALTAGAGNSIDDNLFAATVMTTPSRRPQGRRDGVPGPGSSFPHRGPALPPLELDAEVALEIEREMVRELAEMERLYRLQDGGSALWTSSNASSARLAAEAYEQDEEALVAHLVSSHFDAEGQGDATAEVSAYANSGDGCDESVMCE
ncbi:hypothetical protein HDU83_002292 [Entophlyctis luteolus]|nr:hypothetical protein HDU83_002292 [Entophlyctis luteolus]